MPPGLQRTFTEHHLYLYAKFQARHGRFPGKMQAIPVLTELTADMRRKAKIIKAVSLSM